MRKLLSMLIRYHEGERQVWQVVNVPSVEAEDQRHARDLETLKRERASTTARIKGLLSSQGIQVTSLTKLPEQLDAMRRWGWLTDSARSAHADAAGLCPGHVSQ